MGTDSWTQTRVKNKNTGDIGVIYSSGSDSKGHYYKVCWGSSILPERMSIDDFDKKCEIIEHDYTSIIPQIMEYLKEERLARIPQTVARRLDPDYYKVGDIVYFQSPGYLWGSGEYAAFGPKYPLIITEIRQDLGNEFRFNIILDRYRPESPLNPKGEFSIFFDLTNFYSTDAYNNLARYDKEY